MFGLSRCERGIAIALPVAFLASGLLIQLCSTAFSLWGSPQATCLTPQEFTPNWSAYALRVCSSRSGRHYAPPMDEIPTIDRRKVFSTDQLMAPGEWVNELPRRLFLCAVVLALPLLLADLVDRAATAAPGSRPLTAVGVACRTLGLLLSRVALIVCLGVVIYTASPDAPLSPFDGKMTLCDMQTKRLGKLHTYTLNCVWQESGVVDLGRALLPFLWSAVVAVVVWVVVSTAEVVVLVAFPDTRSHVLETEAAEQAKE